MPDLSLNVVTAYYLDPTNGPTQLLQQNSLMASDLADNWTAFRAAINALGWEPYISPPNDPADPRAAQGYTKGFFRTPDDQALMIQEQGDNAAPMDTSPHQAGRAFDLDLAGMQAAFPAYDYGTVTATAAQWGFTPTVASEPWHFEQGVASLLLTSGLTKMPDAVAAIGNTQAQVAADVAAGQPTPQDAAVSSSSMTNVLLVIGALGLLAALYYLSQNPPGKKTEVSHAGAPQYVF